MSNTSNRIPIDDMDALDQVTGGLFGHKEKKPSHPMFYVSFKCSMCQKDVRFETLLPADTTVTCPHCMNRSNVSVEMFKSVED